LLSGESELTRLDSSIKKNSAFIKKLKLLTADNGKQLLAEAAKLNLSKVGVNKVVPTRTAVRQSIKAVVMQRPGDAPATVCREHMA